MIHTPITTEHPILTALRNLQEAQRREEDAEKAMQYCEPRDLDRMFPGSTPEEICFARTDCKTELYRVMALYGLDLGLIVRGAS